MPWLLIFPLVQGVLGLIGGSGLLPPDVNHWLLLAAGLPLTVQVPLAAHLLAKNTEKTNAAIQTLASLPLANLNVDHVTRSKIYAFADMSPDGGDRPESAPAEPIDFKKHARVREE